LLRVERIRLDQHGLQIEIVKQLLEHGTLVVFSFGAAGLSDRHAQSSGVQRHLSDELQTAAAGSKVLPSQIR
jgi:hypothetical protein